MNNLIVIFENFIVPGSTGFSEVMKTFLSSRSLHIYIYIFVFNFRLLSISFCITFRCTLEWLDNHILYTVFSDRLKIAL